MQKRLRASLLNEEKRTVIWFLWLFYTVYFVYDIFYNYLLPRFFWSSQQDLTDKGLNYFGYIIMLILLPIVFYLFKKNKPGIVKYVYFTVFTLINILTESWFYWGTDIPYSSGNAAEFVIVLFSPIFVNKRFFYFVSIGSILKYAIVGVILQDPVVLLPMLLFAVLALIAYILLNRFLSYVKAVKNSYDQQMEGIVKGIIASLELKDPYTRGHSERVAEYATRLAKATEKFNSSELKSFYYACLLHDIGKIQIPDSILSKSDKLTEEEYRVIKTHPVVGAETLRQVEGVSENIDVIYYHHERWDGSGYPEGLKEESIPLLPRVTAIADAFDAITSSRSYRPALSLDEAYRRIIAGKGTQFDPSLVDLFMKVYPSWVDYYNQHGSIA
ncbi:metal-dependent phosphohydrolase [Virgibacillus phasianinus]|uniref:Metal-dependent phosphohydrolase n=1 Tax=Virgibacillus phasianinus TaxID=2017483 RepID=A0A220U8K2_9BACI|nr:HD-GYP domain-containing protein [Virgibacillus phasianinus]ASK64063.1 metal-dependent phosphohydrolase [Virgibacillus phasianinus]